MIHECWYSQKYQYIMSKNPQDVEDGDIIRIKNKDSYTYIKAERNSAYAVTCSLCPLRRIGCVIHHHNHTNDSVQACSGLRLKLTEINLDSIMEAL